ncbi:MAG: penicillin-insensitive murein endopeptidase [Solirubrobacterales bacterium]
MTARRLVPIAMVLAVMFLAAGRLGPCESRAQETEVMATHEIERIQALNDGGEPAPEPIRWRPSRAIGLPFAGRLERGVRLPAEDARFFTWDPIRRTTPNRWWRRNGTDRLVRAVLEVLGEFQDEHPDASRVGIGDLSRPRGGDFGPRFGYPGHASHQNGLDADVYYPRLDRRERAPLRPAQIDRVLAQDLVDRFVAAGAQYVFVGRRTGLRGPRRVVQAIPHHDNHLHVRLRP